MTNFESMDYTHLYLSAIASLFGTVHCPFSPWELVQTSPVHPNPVIRYTITHKPPFIFLKTSTIPTYYGISIAIPRYIAMQLSTVPFIIIMTYISFVILPLHDHVVDIVFVAKPPCINFHTCHSWFIAPSRYTAGGIHIESYLVLVSSCNSYVVINKSVMIIIIRALSQRKKKIKKRERPKEKKERPKKILKKEKKREMLLSLFPHLCFKVAPCSSCSESHILCFKVAPCFSYSESHKLSFSY